MARKPAKYGSREHHRRISASHRKRCGKRVTGGSYKGKPGRWANLWRWRKRHGAWKPGKTSQSLKRRLRNARRVK